MELPQLQAARADHGLGVPWHVWCDDRAVKVGKDRPHREARSKPSPLKREESHGLPVIFEDGDAHVLAGRCDD